MIDLEPRPPLQLERVIGSSGLPPACCGPRWSGGKAVGSSAAGVCQTSWSVSL